MGRIIEQDFEIESVVYTKDSLGQFKPIYQCIIDDDDTDLREICFNGILTIEKTKASSEWPAETTIKDFEIFDMKNVNLSRSFITNHYVTTRKYNPDTQKLEEIYVTIYDYIMYHVL